MNNEFRLSDKVESAITDTFLKTIELELELVSETYTFSKELNTVERCLVFQKKNSLTKIEFSISAPPKSICLVFFYNQDDSFDFHSYLSSIGSVEQKGIHKNLFFGGTPDLEEQYILEYLSLTKKYLLSTLKRVARGEEWICVQQNWELY